MISTMGRKIFFINPPETLKNEFLDHIFKNEFELYLLDDKKNIEELLGLFQDAVVFINIDKGMTTIEWSDFIKKLQRKFKKVVIAVFSKSNSSSLQKTYLMDIGIKGGFVILEHNNWKTIEIINQVLEANEARGRRKNVRLDFNKNESRDNIKAKVFTHKGYLVHGFIESFSSAGLQVSFKSGNIDLDDNVDKVIFSLGENELHINGSLLKRFENGKYFISFKNISSLDKEFVQQYIFDHLQKSFKQLLNSL